MLVITEVKISIFFPYLPMPHNKVRSKPIQWQVIILFSTLLLTPGLLLSRSSYAGGGHGHGSFKENTGGNAGTVKVDTTTITRLGIKVETVARQSLPIGIQATGQLEALPEKRVDVTTPLTSRVQKVLVKTGDIVNQGQAIAIVTSPELAQLRVDAFDRGNDAQGTIQQAEADLALAQDSYTQQQKISNAERSEAEAAVKSAQERVKFAQERFIKDKELAANGALPRRQVMEAETLLAEAKSVLSQSQSSVTKANNRSEIVKAQSDIKRAESALSIAQNKFALSTASYEARLKQLGTGASSDGTITITAPISGTVTNLKATQGEFRQDAGTPLMSIVDSQSVIANANIYEKDIAKVQSGQQVRVVVDSLPKQEFIGRVTTIGAAVEGETRVIPVKSEIDNSSGKLKPGMFAKIKVVTDRSSTTALVIPSSSVIESNGKNIVFVQNGEAFEPTDVEIGQTIGNFIEVRKGLFDGDKVVTQRANQLYTQSLSGSGGEEPKDEHGSEEKQAGSGFTVPNWIVLAGSGTLVAVAFFGGMTVASRKNFKKNPFEKPSEILLADVSKNDRTGG